MFSLNPALSHLVDHTNAENWAIRVLQERELLQSIQATPNCAALAEHVAAELSALEDGLKRFSDALVPLHEAFAKQQAARQACEAAARIHGLGSEDPKAALKARDALDAAQAAVRYCAQKFEAARLAVPRLSPLTGGNELRLRGEGIVDAWERISVVRHFKTGRSNAQIEPEVWERWLDLPEDALIWIPYYLEKSCMESEKMWKKNGNDANRVWDSTSREGAPHPDDLR